MHVAEIPANTGARPGVTSHFRVRSSCGAAAAGQGGGQRSGSSLCVISVGKNMIKYI